MGDPISPAILSETLLNTLRLVPPDIVISVPEKAFASEDANLIDVLSPLLIT